MELSTQCPRCGTVFPATLEQLQLRKGYIRCINCAHIFDGYESVVSGDPAAGAAAPAPASTVARPAAPPRAEPPEPATEPVHSWTTMRPAVPAPAQAPSPTPTAPAAAATASAAAPQPGQPIPSVLRQRTGSRGDGAAWRKPESAPDQSFSLHIPDEDDFAEGPRFTLSSARLPARQRSEPSLDGGPDAGAADTDAGQQDGGALDGPAAARAAVYAEPGRAQESRSTIYVEPRRGDADEPLPEFLETRGRRWRSALRMFWGVLTLLALVVLLAQFVYVYRGQIADHSPELRPMLQRACVALKCEVPYARRILLISITNSSLRSVPAGGTSAGGKSAAGNNDSSRMLLQLTLRNDDERAQEWPTLTLDLVDFSGSVVSKKNLAPENYLPAELRGAPFAPHSEVALAVPLTVTGYHVNGYQLGKFFP